MARSLEEGEVEQELEMKEREKRRKSWKKIEDQCHEVKRENGSVRIFLDGTSKPLLVSDSPGPLTCFVLRKLCIMQDCARGVIRERKTRSLAFQPSLRIGEYDFIPFQPNSFLCCDAFIYNDVPPVFNYSRPPALSHLFPPIVKRFKAELAIDMGWHTDLVVSQRTARQLGFIKYGEHVIQGFGGALIAMQMYMPVLVCLLKEGRTFKRTILQPSARLKEEEDHFFVGFQDVHNVMDVERAEVKIQSTEDLPTKALLVPLKVKQFSPYKDKAAKVPDAILGSIGLWKLQLTMGFEKWTASCAHCWIGFD